MPWASFRALWSETCRLLFKAKHARASDVETILAVSIDKGPSYFCLANILHSNGHKKGEG